MTTQTYNVKGMHCASCATLITMEIEEISGVEQVSVDSEKAQAIVAFTAEPISVEKLNAVIEPHGYEFISSSVTQ